MNKLILMVASVLLAALSTNGYSGAGDHYDVTRAILTGYGDDGFKELFDSTSSAIDGMAHDFSSKHQLTKEFNPWTHRLMGHGWSLDEEVPKHVLEVLQNEYGVPQEQVVAYWHDFQQKTVQRAVELTGLPTDKAKAFASLIIDLHQLEDIEPGNKVVKQVLRTTDLVDRIGRHLDVLLADHPGYAAKIKGQLGNVLNLCKRLGVVDQSEVASYLIDQLMTTRLGDMIHKVYPKDVLKLTYDADRVVNANAAAKAARDRVAALKGQKRPMPLADRKASAEVKYLSQRMSVGRIFRTNPMPQAYERNVAKASENIANRQASAIERVFAKDSRLVRSLEAKGCAKIRTTTGLLQTIGLKNGTTIKVLHVPVENVANGINAGLSAGIMTFILSEGVTGYCYFKGDISKDKFVIDSTKNCAAALLTGTATFVAVALGAAPGGPVVLAIGIGTYLLCDIAFSRLERAIEYQRFHIEDILGEFPVEFQRRRSTLEYDGYENLLQYAGNKSAIDFKGTESSTLEYRGNSRSLLEPNPKEKSLLEQ